MASWGDLFKNLLGSEDSRVNPDYVTFLKRFIKFDKLVEVDQEEDDPSEAFELTNAVLKVPFVNIKYMRGQYVFREQNTLTFSKAQLHIFPTYKEVRFYHEDGTYNWVEPMLWSQYFQAKESQEHSVRVKLPARTHRNHFMYQTRREDPSGYLYTNAFLNRSLKAINGSTIESGGNLRVSNNFIVLPDGDMCPLPSFSVPSLVFGAEGWLGVGVRGGDSISTDLLALLCEVCSSHFETPLTVIPLDINDSIIPCDGCDDESKPCVCEQNKGRIERFSFISHLCLLHNSQDVPYRNLAAGLWISMENEKKVAVEMEGSLVRVVSSPSGVSDILGSSTTT